MATDHWVGAAGNIKGVLRSETMRADVQSIRSQLTRRRSPVCLARRMNRYVGNLAPMPGVFPDYPAPVIRNVGDAKEMALMRWGMPPPPKTSGLPVTNIRNTSSPHWRGWLRPENRCLVPANSFAEYAPEPDPETKKKDVVWFAIEESRPLFCFAGIWTEFRGDRGTKSKPIPGPHLVYGFLTTSPNAVVQPIPQSDAGDPDQRGGARRLDARSLGRGEGAAAPFARRRAEDRHAWRR
ncbi:putative SOS response-associated peptidase YedK [Bradyrhizobium sp. USDA 10063]